MATLTMGSLHTVSAAQVAHASQLRHISLCWWHTPQPVWLHPPVASTTTGVRRRALRRALRSTATAGNAVTEAAPASQSCAQGLPTTYKRLVARRTGASFREVAQLEEAPLQLPGPGQVLVKVLYAGINGGCETFRVRGEYAFQKNRHVEWFPLGAEGAGVVAAVGPDVTHLQVGQHVTCVGAGAFAEYVMAQAGLCWPVREASAEVTALTISGVTAAAALWATAGMQASDTVLVTAAAGGTGHFAAQLAQAAGCRVVATCGGARKAAALRRLGLHRIIDHTREDVATVLQREFGGQISLCYEGVGGAMRQAALAALAPAGRMLVVGYISEYPHNREGVAQQAPAHAQGSELLSGMRTTGLQPQAQEQAAPPGAAAPLPASPDLFWQGQTVQRGQQTIYGQVWPKDRAEVLRCKQKLFDLFYAGQLEAWIDSRTFSGLDSVPDAIEHMLSGNTIGKVVVAI